MIFFIIIIFLCGFFFAKSTSSGNFSSNTSRVYISLHPDQARQNVVPDLGPNCLQTRGTSRQMVKSWRLLAFLL